MISIEHAWAVTLRHIKLLLHDTNMQIAFLFWPFLDIVIWGYVGTWMQQGQGSLFQQALLGSIFLWQIVNRGSIIVCFGLLEELWSQNLTGLFSTPLRLCEWIIGVIFYSALTALVIFLYCSILIKLLYMIPASFLWHCTILYGPPLFISSLALGLLSLQVVVYRGKRAAEFVFLAVWLTAPLSGVFYPTEVLPTWLQKIGSVLPMTYIFRALRQEVLEGRNPFNQVAMSYVLSTLYLIAALVLFTFSFKKTKEAGLARLMD